MAFPWLALITAGASDLQSRANHANQVSEAGNAARERILRSRAAQLGGDQYGLMATDFDSSLAEMDRQADAQRNNNIGALLQAYLRESPADSGKTIGGGNPSAGLASGWEDDPWGSGGF